MHFGATLRLLRTSRGWSLTGLASHIGVSPAYLSRVEHGHDAPPTPDRLRAIAAVLGLSEDTLAALAEGLRPEAAEWLGQTPAGRHLAAELRRRGLGQAQLARVTEFVQREFPLDTRTEGISGLFTEETVIRGVSVSTLRDAFDVAAVRLVDRAALATVAEELLPQGRATGVPPPCAIGGGLCVAHARADGPLRGVLLLLARPLDLPTPDDGRVRAVVVLVGPSEAEVAAGVARVARIAAGGLVPRLLEAPSAAGVLRLLG